MGSDWGRGVGMPEVSPVMAVVLEWVFHLDVVQLLRYTH